MTATIIVTGLGLVGALWACLDANRYARRALAAEQRAQAAARRAERAARATAEGWSNSPTPRRIDP
jgi:hypothetical protein